MLELTATAARMATLLVGLDLVLSSVPNASGAVLTYHGSFNLHHSLQALAHLSPIAAPFAYQPTNKEG